MVSDFDWLLAPLEKVGIHATNESNCKKEARIGKAEKSESQFSAYSLQNLRNNRISSNFAIQKHEFRYRSTSITLHLHGIQHYDQAYYKIICSPVNQVVLQPSGDLHRLRQGNFRFVNK